MRLLAIASVCVLVSVLPAHAEVLTYEATFTMLTNPNGISEAPTFTFVYDTDAQRFLDAELGWEAALRFPVQDQSGDWNHACFDDTSLIYESKPHCASGGPAYLFSVLTAGEPLTWIALVIGVERDFFIDRADGYRLWFQGPGTNGAFPNVHGSGTLTVSQVPEPPVWALLVIGAGFLVRRQQIAAPQQEQSLRG